MATQLKNLKFGDYTLKGTSNNGGGMSFLLGSNDTVDMQGYGTILSYSSNHDGWFLDGYAKYVTDGIPGVLEKDGCGNWTFNGKADTAGSVEGALEYDAGCGYFTLNGIYQAEIRHLRLTDSLILGSYAYSLDVDQNGFVKATRTNI